MRSRSGSSRLAKEQSTGGHRVKKKKMLTRVVRVKLGKVEKAAGLQKDAVLVWRATASAP
jgi:hypothetical protein